MTKRHIILPLFLSLLTLCASAQRIVPQKQHDSNILNHLDLGINAGTTGLGITMSMPVGNAVRLRTGFDYMPRTDVPLKFELMSYLPGNFNESDPGYDRFNKMASLLESFTGLTVDRYVDTHARGTMYNFKLLVDVYPFKHNHHWHATAGFYWGSSRVGHVENVNEEAPSMVGVLMYNKLYDFFADERYLYEPIYSGAYISPDVGDQMRDKFIEYGMLGAKNGYFKEGSPFAGQPYMMTPDLNGTVHANMYVNSFKPYIGVGYETTLSNDGRWNFGIDAGALFWGRPKVYTHERYIYDKEGTLVSYGTISPDDTDKYTYGKHVDMANEIENVVGKVGSCLDLAKAIRVFPVLNLRLTYKLF